MTTIDYDEQARTAELIEEQRNPGSTERKRATRVRLKLVADAVQTTKDLYQDILTKIVRNDPHDPVELLRLSQALGRSERDIATDLEDCAADLADEEDARRADAERRTIEGKIGTLQDDANGFAAVANESFNECMELQAKINELHDAVGQKEKEAYRQAVAENHRGLADQKQALADIEQLTAKLESIQPEVGRKARLLGERKARQYQEKHDAKKRESDQAMQKFADAQASEELPPDLLHAALNPMAPTPPTQNLGAVKLGTKNGEPVVVSAGRLV